MMKMQAGEWKTPSLCYRLHYFLAISPSLPPLKSSNLGPVKGDKDYALLL